MLSKKKKKLLIMGATIGFVNGIFGGGGGIIAVSLLTNKLCYPQKQAHATSLLIMLPTSITSALVYIFSGYFPFKSGSIITIGVVLGGVIGAFLLKLVKQKVIKYTFIFLMLISGIKLVLV
jgi:uncharacterized membrane protein YfcA